MNKVKAYSITGMIAEESQLRYQSWLKYGCNSFEQDKPKSNPMMFWTNQDVLQYIKEKNLAISSIYGNVIEDDKCKLCTSGAERTGCVFCLFGSHREKISRLKILEKSHKQLYDYCMNGGEFVNGIWQPNANGLGMKFVIDTANNIVNNFKIEY